jgi:hypothetical protein
MKGEPREVWMDGKCSLLEKGNVFDEGALEGENANGDGVGWGR